MIDIDYKAEFQKILAEAESVNWTNRESGASMLLAKHGAEFMALIVDGLRYRHRRFITVSDELAMSGVMAISPELFNGVLAEYDLHTDNMKPMELDWD